MAEMTFVVAPGAKLALSLLSPQEKQRLASLMSGPIHPSVKRTPAGHFFSQLGDNKRVLWEKRPDSPATVLSIADGSYAAA